MKKTVGNIILAVLFSALTVSTAFAQEALFKEVSGPKWSVFKEALEKDGLLKNETFPTEVLAKNAYLRAKKENLPAGNLPFVEFYELFKFTNNLGDTISVSEFRTLAQAGKIVSPDVNDAPVAVKAQAETKQVVQVAPVKTEQSAQSPAMGLQAIAIANLQGKVEELSGLVGKTAKQQKQVEALARDVNGVKNQLGSLQDNFAGKEELATVKGQFDAQQVMISSLTQSGNALTEVSKKFADRLNTAESKLKAVEGSPAQAWGGMALYGLIAFALFFIALSVINWRRTTAVKKVVEAKNKEFSERVTVVEEQIGGRVEVDTKTLDQIIERVKLQNEEGKGTVQHLLTVGGKAYTLRFVFESAGYVMVEGIKDQTQKVHIDKLRATVLRAAGADRIVGAGKPFSIVDDDTVRVAAEDNPFAGNSAKPQSEKEMPAVMTSRRFAAG